MNVDEMNDRLLSKIEGLCDGLQQMCDRFREGIREATGNGEKRVGVWLNARQASIEESLGEIESWLEDMRKTGRQVCGEIREEPDVDKRKELSVEMHHKTDLACAKQFKDLLLMSLYWPISSVAYQEHLENLAFAEDGQKRHYAGYQAGALWLERNKHDLGAARDLFFMTSRELLEGLLPHVRNGH